MITIQEEVIKLSKEHKLVEIGDMLGISYSMVSRYKVDYLPSIEVAKRYYTLTNKVLHPFAEESLIKEIQNERTT